MSFELPRIPLGDGIEAALDFLVDHLALATRAFSAVADQGLRFIETSLLGVHPVIVIVIVTALVFFMTRKRGVTVFTFLGLGLIWNMGLWTATASTLSLVVVATLIAIAIGIPLGIIAGLSDWVYRIVRPILDFMQTLPAFVYLIPAIPFFGLGKVAAIFATVVFSMPPAIRFTNLGIRQVPKELTECADAFGADRWQKLFKIQLPLAKTTIMGGVNQTVMLALSMVVIAAMIGAGGLGGEVWRAIQRLQPGAGFEAGIGIVILAIILDRLLQSLASKD
ncbi:binding-protein-dependent transport systems inner membrane component [Desulfonatronospira thiodismutans ASO3-1]|uniref:Binding-protein-dependent transport systems inner membrane component n=1 Tax=Desulfonatronospira thiodismutans ASO3-1 TaxID=555779 RepID=D6SPB1_9BACT|nr:MULTISPECIES: proline/glycine betaine ABC transporter permease [Desulfonatronospira]EFI34587.1 binding-protein-dependent transport systems inner membrane component [Desulfonatronospira thiodismutans ASO3-1]RQD76414.1 MAG: proline/glycine betaine ABC transporter permease [Desulfonatronospira sp. MSAO_Bac3]